MYGDKNLFGLYRGVGRYLASQGYVAVLVNYRLSPAVKHPEHVRDIARAYAWVRQNIGKHGGDPDRIVLAGHSAGGHLVALLAVDDGFWNGGDPKLTATDRAALRGVVAVSGVYRIPGADETGAMVAELLGGVRPGVRPRGLEKGTRFNLFKIVFGEDAEVRGKASPITHVERGKPLPPFLVLHAERELPLLPQMAKEFGRKLRDTGHAVEEQRIPGCHHNTILFRLSEREDPTAKALLAFLASVK
jgi:acetyl esterase/lipase